MIGSPWLEGRDRYERALDGWVDSTQDDAFAHTMRIADPDFSFEVRALCTPSPAYEIREMEAWALTAPDRREPAGEFAALRGTRMVSGYTKRLAESAGEGPAADLLVAAGVEVARLARQVARLPPAETKGLRPGDALRCWELDNLGWQDLPDSCFAYTKAARALFDQREVTTPLPPAIYGAPPGSPKIFCRRKVIRMVQTGPRLDLFHSLHDNAHGFDVHYQLDLDTGTIVDAGSITSRLPYRGICDEPQPKIASMEGQSADGGLRKRIQTLLGGETGCTQLYDLTSDLFKLLGPP